LAEVAGVAAHFALGAGQAQRPGVYESEAAQQADRCRVVGGGCGQLAAIAESPILDDALVAPRCRAPARF
jgi:hypothetical protein